MKIRIERRGGLAGLRAAGERTEQNLTPPQRAAVEQLLRAPPPYIPSPGADRFKYHVTIEHGGGTSELDLSEETLPEVLAGIAQN